MTYRLSDSRPTAPWLGKCCRVVLLLLAAWGLLLHHAAAAPAVTVHLSVPGTSNPWLAGQPDGIQDPPDVAPGQSPVLVPGGLVPGSQLTFAVSGAVANCPAQPGGSCCPTCGPAFPSPDGAIPGPGVEYFSHREVHNVANVVAPINSLIGVFLRPTVPDAHPAPTALDFSVTGLSFSAIAPALQQPFFIGDGLTGTGTGSVQVVKVPAGATRLFLGTLDGAEWVNNAGQFEVAVTMSPVPEPAHMPLMVAGLLLLAIRQRVRKLLRASTPASVASAPVPPATPSRRRQWAQSSWTWRTRRRACW